MQNQPGCDSVVLLNYLTMNKALILEKTLAIKVRPEKVWFALTDQEGIKKLLEEGESLMLADDPVIPLYFYVSKHLISTKISGWEDNILDIHASQYLGVNSESNKH